MVKFTLKDLLMKSSIHYLCYRFIGRMSKGRQMSTGESEEVEG